MVHIALACRGQHGAGAEEQQALEQRVVEDVEQRGGQRQRGRSRQMPLALKASASPSPTKMMPIFSIVLIGEHALEIVLHQRIEHAEERRAPPIASTGSSTTRSAGRARSKTMRMKP